MGRVPAFRQKNNHKLSCLCISIVLMMLLGVIAADGIKLMNKQNDYQERIAELQAKIDEENQRTIDLDEFEKYTKTRKYAEEIAEDKLGLVHDDEIIFKPEKDDN